ncbi:MAG: dienelactone hydrolase family protein [Anaerolineaceae bacterium]|nr:dienelactone hydrolase family protein [Anaerolineaceae bacterium]
MGERKQYREGDELANAYMAIPESGKGPGVIMLHAWWGLNAFFMKLCDLLSQEGFVTLAPDLYHGEVATTIDEARNLRSKINRKVANMEMKGAITYLLSHEVVTKPKVSLIGFSLGASYANWLAVNKPNDIQSVVLFYGEGGGNFEKSKATYLGHYAEKDQYGAGPENVQIFKERLLKAGREVTFYTYKDTEHWFFEEDRPDAYHAESAKLAWARTIEFLRKQYQHG